MSGKTHQCEGCGKKLSKSGYYKHRKKCPDYLTLSDSPPKMPPKESTETVQFSDPTPEPVEPSEAPEEPLNDNSEDIPIEEAERPDWFDFDMGEEEGATEHFPTALRMVAGQGPIGELGRKPSQAQIDAMHNTNLNLLILTLGGVDQVLQTYGRAVTLDKELVVKHSAADKEMVAHAQYNWLLEKGINPSQFVSTGAIAAALTGYYIVPPFLKIRKRSKVKLFTGMALSRTGGFLAKIPLIGRFFKRRSIPPAETSGRLNPHE